MAMKCSIDHRQWWLTQPDPEVWSWEFQAEAAVVPPSLGRHHLHPGLWIATAVDKQGARFKTRSIQKLSAFQPFRCRAAGTPGTPCARSGIHSLTLAVTSSQSSIDSVEQKVEGQPRKERSFYFFLQYIFSLFFIRFYKLSLFPLF